MSGEKTVRGFLGCYQQHDFKGMQAYLADAAEFSDFAFQIQDNAVKAMWHWFCIPYTSRPDPVKVPEFEVISVEGDRVIARYRVVYLYGEALRPVDYWIRATFTVSDGKIVTQTDRFDQISAFEFARMAFGLPVALLAFTPLLRSTVQKKATEKLNKFSQEYGY
ncbi:nuclear transport factor 2 family protein [Leptolyngbya sp. GGD]|uniref:nuclear transport factor 2 family protein n=1 Tax=Leptolyngbya sp. GGD TaxID=2997907 RepID=UPI00227CEC93|nr:nuclear transport factor 2 family protein [Leptolyngbya sp. GGD]MCY6492804.1 nuclear transport factor 2 family protein [Leptolyngbya sp. GGD]